VAREESGKKAGASRSGLGEDAQFAAGYEAIFGTREPAVVRQQGAGIDWESLRPIGPEVADGIPGTRSVGRTHAGEGVAVWKGENGEYFCHALTFGGKEAPRGPFSPHAEAVDTLLAAGRGYRPVEVHEARAGDVVVWRDRSTDRVLHSALLVNVEVYQSRGQSFFDDVTTTLRSKNGANAPEGISILLDLDAQYGTTRSVFRKG
jgi:hypothetical protein